MTERDAYYASDSFINREPSDRFEMLYNADTNLLYLHYYYDFDIAKTAEQTDEPEPE